MSHPRRSREANLSLHASADEASLRASYRSIGSSYKDAQRLGEKSRNSVGGTSAVRARRRLSLSSEPGGRAGENAGSIERLSVSYSSHQTNTKLENSASLPEKKSDELSKVPHRSATTSASSSSSSSSSSTSSSSSASSSSASSSSASSSSSSSSSPDPLDWWREYPPPRAVPPSPPLRAPPDLLFEEKRPRKSPVNLDDVPVGLHADGNFETLLERALAQEEARLRACPQSREQEPQDKEQKRTPGEKRVRCGFLTSAGRGSLRKGEASGLRAAAASREDRADTGDSVGWRQSPRESGVSSETAADVEGEGEAGRFRGRDWERSFDICLSSERGRGEGEDSLLFSRSLSHSVKTTRTKSEIREVSPAASLVSSDSEKMRGKQRGGGVSPRPFLRRRGGLQAAFAARFRASASRENSSGAATLDRQAESSPDRTREANADASCFRRGDAGRDRQRPPVRDEGREATEEMADREDDEKMEKTGGRREGRPTRGARVAGFDCTLRGPQRDWEEEGEDAFEREDDAVSLVWTASPEEASDAGVHERKGDTKTGWGLPLREAPGERAESRYTYTGDNAFERNRPGQLASRRGADASHDLIYSFGEESEETGSERCRGARDLPLFASLNEKPHREWRERNGEPAEEDKRAKSREDAPEQEERESSRSFCATPESERGLQRRCGDAGRETGAWRRVEASRRPSERESRAPLSQRAGRDLAAGASANQRDALEDASEFESELERDGKAREAKPADRVYVHLASTRTGSSASVTTADGPEQTSSSTHVGVLSKSFSTASELDDDAFAAGLADVPRGVHAERREGDARGEDSAPISDLVRSRFYGAEARVPTSRLPCFPQRPSSVSPASESGRSRAQRDEDALLCAETPAAGYAEHREQLELVGSSVGGFHSGETLRREEKDACSPAVLESRLELLKLQLQRLRDGEARLRRISTELQKQRNDLAYEREALHRSVEEERRLAMREVEAGRQAVLREKRRVATERAKLRESVQQQQEQQERHRALQSRLEEVQEEFRTAKERWRATVQRLRREKEIVQEENCALKEELSLAEQQFRSASKGKKGAFLSARAGGLEPHSGVRTPRAAREGSKREAFLCGALLDDRSFSPEERKPKLSLVSSSSRPSDLPELENSHRRLRSGSRSSGDERRGARGETEKNEEREGGTERRERKEREGDAGGRPVRDSRELALSVGPESDAPMHATNRLSLSDWEEAVETTLQVSSSALRNESEKPKDPSAPRIAVPPSSFSSSSASSSSSSVLVTQLRAYEEQLRHQQEQLEAQQWELERQRRLIAARRREEENASARTSLPPRSEGEDGHAQSPSETHAATSFSTHANSACATHAVPGASFGTDAQVSPHLRGPGLLPPPTDRTCQVYRHSATCRPSPAAASPFPSGLSRVAENRGLPSLISGQDVEAGVSGEAVRKSEEPAFAQRATVGEHAWERKSSLTPSPPSYVVSPALCSAAALPSAPSPQFFAGSNRAARASLTFPAASEARKSSEATTSVEAGEDGREKTADTGESASSLEERNGTRRRVEEKPPGSAEAAQFSPRHFRRSMQDLLQFDFDGPFQRGREALFQLLKNPGDIAHEKEKAGRREIIYHTGLRRLLYESGLQKVQANNGWNFVLFVNGDLRISTRDETHIYHFAEQNILQYTLPDGKKYNRFADGQREVQFSDGHVQILFSNGIKKEIFTNKAEEITFPDGTRQVKLPTQAGTACTASAS
ncbi:T-complex protein 10 C-terminus protein [Toxoplasma gondii VAND]|uniref:T-complex protein 10 C-terminus protein n=1 Tax=Toxoplasma gondii VAND TaxID=933077 RepID=A0A086PK39_TOXGO|nr:T-complex protein 10 C-terminus protein [Toxoplasma gondii VAND]